MVFRINIVILPIYIGIGQYLNHALNALPFKAPLHLT